MSTSVLATKLYRPPPRPSVVRRPRLVEQLQTGLSGKLTLLSAPAGFGKTTLLSDWLASSTQPVAWLSLEEADADPIRFLTYVVAALQTASAEVGAGVMRAFNSPQPPPILALLTPLLNDLSCLTESLILVLDDYHRSATAPIDQALTFLLEHLPPHLHLVIATREDPDLPLGRWRGRGDLTELRAADLRFTRAEATTFLTEVMGLSLSPAELATLSLRTEGWIAGLHLAALSLRSQPDASRAVASFSGSHRFVLDYLVEEVLQQQPASVQTFLLRTSVLDRLSGPLCAAVLLEPEASVQATLDYLEHANLFLIPLDTERRWYRYHQLFADLLRQRLPATLTGSSLRVAELHCRASAWYEEQGMELDAFHHAAAAEDFPRAERLIAGNSMPLHFHGAVKTLLDWLGSLPTPVLNERPSLWVHYASLLLVNGQTTGVEDKLQAAEAALRGAEFDRQTRGLVGQIAAARATLALTRYQVDGMLVQSDRALEWLDPSSSTARATALWTRAFAHLIQGNRAASRRDLADAMAISEAAGDTFTTILATIGLGNVQEADNQLSLAAETYQRVLDLAGEQPQQIVHEAHLGLARISYERNDLQAAERHGQLSLELARQYDRVIDRYLLCEVFLARLKLAQADLAAAEALLATAEQSARQRQFLHRLPDISEVQVLTMLRRGHLTAAARLAAAYPIPASRARVHLAAGDPAAALAVLAPWREEIEARGWAEARIKALLLETLAFAAQDKWDQVALRLLDALALAEPGDCLRSFVDEGRPLEKLLVWFLARREPGKYLRHGEYREYVGKVLAAFAAERSPHRVPVPPQPASPLVEPLSRREVEVLRLIAEGCSNQEISRRLFVALDTVKGHNRTIFSKLQVGRRTEAVARARELGLL